MHHRTSDDNIENITWHCFGLLSYPSTEKQSESSNQKLQDFKKAV